MNNKIISISPSASNTEIIAKINEIIYEMNKITIESIVKELIDLLNSAKNIK